MTFPGRFARTIVEMHGEAGRAWLGTVPAVAGAYAERWGVTLGEPFANLTYNYVVPGVTADGEPVVLKLGYPAEKDALSEQAALRLAGGDGMVAVLAADPDGPATLIRRAVPGHTLHSVPDDVEATRIAAVVMSRLWRPAAEDHPFPTVAGWGDGFRRMRDRFGGGTGPLPPELTARAEALFAELVATSAAPVVLHGDLHHDNILRDGDDWVAIDPKGLVGEPAYEVGALMRNRLPDLGDGPAATAFLVRRLRIVARITGLDADRMRRWVIAQALLSAWWTVEDGGDVQAFAADVIRTADLLEGVTLA